MKECRLGDVSTISYGYTAKASHTRLGPKLLRITDIQNGAVDWKSVPTCHISPEDIERYRLVDGDIVFARTGATTGKSYRIVGAPEAVPASYLIRVRVTKPDIDPRFVELFFQTNSYWDMVTRGTSGSAQGGFNASKLAELVVPLPPLPEQKYIVAVLDEAFAGITTAVANTEKNLANARELFESYLNTVFSERGDGWIEKPLEALVQKSCSLSYGIVQPGANVSCGLPVVRPTDLTEKVVKLRSLKTIDPSLAKAYARTTLHGGDLLLCVRGSTGVVSIADNELKGANVTRGIVPIRFDPYLVTQEIGYYLLKAPSVQEQIAEKTYGAALMQVNIRDLRKIRILIPPRDKHEELVGMLDDLSAEARRLESIYQRKLNALAELKQSLLQKAFAGDLTTASHDEIETALA